MKERYSRNDLLVIPKETVESVKEPEKYVISKLVKPMVINGVHAWVLAWLGVCLITR